MKRSVAAWFGQISMYVVFAILIAAFSAWPTSARVEPGLALIKMSFTHAGVRLKECRKLDAAEIAELAPNMRVQMDCERGRVPIVVELMLDGKQVYLGSHEPTGLWGDGPSVIYEKFWVPAGAHQIEVRIRDTGRQTGFDYVKKADLWLAEFQNLVIDFHADKNGIVLH